MFDSMLKNANILIVDDQQENIDVLVSLLENKGYTNIKTTTDSRLAVSLFKEFKPDLLLLDLKIPYLTGFQVMALLKPLIPADTYFPILILTADMTHEAKQLALSGGATDFLAKPFDMVEVDLRIKNLLKERFLHLQLENHNQILDEAAEFGENLIDTIREPLLALDQDLRVVKASRSFYDFFKVNSKETIGTLIYDLGNHQWDIPKLRELLETILPEKATFDNYEVEHIFSTIGKRIMLLNARQIKRAFGKEKIILLAIEDITERKRVEASLSDTNRMTNEYLDILFNHAHAPIIIWNTSFLITHINHAFEKLCGYDWNELKDKKIDVLFPKDKVESTHEIINTTLQSDERPDIIEIDILTKNKEVKTVLWNPATIFDKEGNHIVATIAQDITQRKLTEKKMLDSEERFRSLYENSTIGLYRTTPDGKILMANKALVKLLGYPSFEKLAERNLENDGFEPSYQRNEFINKIENEGEVKDFESEWTTKDGSIVNISESAKGIRNSNGKTLYYDGIVENITERKRAEDLLLESEDKYRSFFENSMDSIFLTSPDGTIFSANPAACEMFGYSEDEFIKLGRSGIVDTTDPHLPVMLSERELKGKVRCELTFIRKDGAHFPADISSAIFKDQKDRNRTNMIISDITERKRAEESLIKLSSAIEQTADAVVITDREGIIEYVNPSFEELTGYSSEEVLGKTPRILKSGTRDQKFYEEMWKTILSGNVFRAEVVNKKKNGDSYYEDQTISPIFDKNKNITHFVGTGVDITERRKLELEKELDFQVQEALNKILNITGENISLEESLARILTIIISLPFLSLEKKGGILITEEGQNILKLKTSFNLSEKIQTMCAQVPFGHCMCGRAAATRQIQFVDRLDEGHENSYEGIKPHGHYNVPILTSDKVLGVIVVYLAEYHKQEKFEHDFLLTAAAILSGLIQRKRAEKEVAMLAQSLKSINECVSITDMDEKILFVNESFLKTYGYAKNELVGKHISIVRSSNNPPELVNEIMPSTMHGGWQGELWNRRKDGSEFQIYLSTTLIKDKDGKSIGLIGVAIEITERKRAEKELIEAKEKAEQSDKLKTEFLSQMSHEIRTPLNIILGSNDFLHNSYGDKMDSDTRECFESIDLASKRIIRTIDLILNAAELHTSGYIPDLQKIDLDSEILIKLYKEHELLAKHQGIELIYKNDTAISSVITADEYSITQIFANLIDNAIKYTKKGKVEILLEKNETGNIVVEVKDTGIGMKKEFLSKLYEPFVQEDHGYSRTFDGNGLGLAIAKNYCEINNAIMEVESEKNVGSTFRVIFDKKVTEA